MGQTLLLFSICTIFFYYFFSIINIVGLILLLPLFQLHTPIPIIHLNSITITSLNTKADNLTGTFDLIFFFDTQNCDDHIISYSDLEIGISWPGKKEITLAKTMLPPFTQLADSITMIRAELTMVDGFSNNSDVAIGIGMERENTGSVQISVSLLVLFSWRDDTLKEMKLNYYPVAVKFPYDSNNGTWKRDVSPPMHNFKKI